MPSLNDVVPFFGGKTAQNPANVLEFAGIPSASATSNKLGTIAIDTNSSTGYVLTSLSGNTATWSQMGAGGGGSVSTLTGNSGGAVSASANNINILGSGALAFAGAGSTLTGSIVPGSSLVAQLTGNSGGALAPSAGVMNIVGTGAISVAGAGNTLTISTTASGTVTSVSGTAGQIVSSGGAAPTISIDPAYLGQTSITQLGTVTAGTWSATAIAATKGGTAQTTYTTGDLLYASGANTLSKLPIGTAAQVLTVSAGVPSWSSAGAGVTSVSGTAARITSTGGATPIIDIAGTYVGQASITTLGTIATGVWNGTGLDVAHGGTGVVSTTAFAVLCGGTTSTGALQSVSGLGTSGQVLTSAGAGALPTWTAAAGGVSLAAFGASANANGLTLTGTVLNMEPASASFPGGVSTGAQSFAGVKTFGSSPILSSLTGVLSANGASALTASAVTQFGVIVGGAANALASTSVGATGTILQGNSGAAPTYSTATYPSTTTVNQLLYSSATNVVGGVSAVIDGVLISNHASGVPSWLANGTAGQVLTANTNAPPSWQAGGGGGGGLTWTDKSGAFSPTATTGSFVTGTATGTLPASPTAGDTIAFIVDASAVLTIQATGSQIIRLGSAVSAAAGTCASSVRGDAITLVYRATDTAWLSVSAVGTWTLT